VAWIERGGVFATANLRGGSEYGDEWHRAGVLANKQNTIDDLVAAAECLVQRGYTSSSHLGVMGNSNGALVAAAAIMQHPELVAVALLTDGVFDMLRYHRFTSGYLWASEYGCSENPAEFAYLAKYSPLHNVRAGKSYPATLVLVAANDDRVVPSHSFKFTAALQAAQESERPILIRVQLNASHGYRSTGSRINELADSWALAWDLLSKCVK